MNALVRLSQGPCMIDGRIYYHTRNDLEAFGVSLTRSY